MRVLIVEDHELLAQSLAASLRADGVDAAVNAGPTTGDVLAAARDHRPDLVLLDLDLGEALGDGKGLIAPLADTGARVVVLTGSEDRVRHAECLEAGAAGVLRKTMAYEDLLAAIPRATGDDPLMPGHERDALLAELRRGRADEERRLAAFARLTPREQQVLAALMDGETAERIAEAAVVSVTTVRSQIRSLLMKLGVNSQLSAVALARQAGWTPDA